MGSAPAYLVICLLAAVSGATCTNSHSTAPTRAAFVALSAPTALKPQQLRPNSRTTRSAQATPRAPGHELYRGEGPPVITGPLSAAQIDEFYQEGFVIVRGLVDEELLKRVRGENCQSTLPSSEYETLAFNAWLQDPIWLELAMHSKIVHAVAQLTPSVACGAEDLHIIKDAVFAFKGDEKNPGKSGCDWHVDDAFFWPASLDSNGPGVNVWMPLDPVTADGGGLCIAAQSHTEQFLDCREAIQNGGTCSMAQLYADGRERLEKQCVRPELQPGDAILHTRFLFHRTDPFRAGSAAIKGPGVRRYTVRYMPSSATVTGLDKYSMSGKPIFFQSQRLDSADPARFPRVRLNT